jgi:hypothetical protein
MTLNLDRQDLYTKEIFQNSALTTVMLAEYLYENAIVFPKIFKRGPKTPDKKHGREIIRLPRVSY